MKPASPIMLLAGASLLALGACAPTPPRQQADPAPRQQPAFIQASPDSLVARGRVDVPGGQSVLIPLDASVGERLAAMAAPPESRVPAWLDRGNTRAARAVDARVVRVVRSVGDQSDPWLGDPGKWTSLSAEQARATPVNGVWALVVDLFGPDGDALDDVTPAEDDGAPILRVGLAADSPIIDFTINPLPARDRLIRAQGPDTPWRPILEDDDRADAAVLAAIAPEATSPITRWRHRLAIDGLDPAADRPTLPRFEDGAIEILAQQNEDRWRVALAWLWFANADTAQRLKARLACVARFASPSVTGQAAAKGRLAPLWPLDHADLDTLLSELLEPRIDAAQRVTLAERWLARQSAAAAWIHDDGGVLSFTDSGPVVVASVGVVNLLDRATLAWTTLSSSEPTPDLKPVASMSGLILSRPVVLPSGRSPNTPPTLTAHIGSVAAVLPVQAAPTPASPPGAAMGPFLPDWTMDSFQSAEPGAIDASWASAALVHKAVDASTGDAWEVFVECHVPAASRHASHDASRESVTMYLGPSGAPSAVVRVSRDGAVSATGPLAETFPSRVEVIRAEDRWSFRLRLSERAIEEHAVIRVGLMRTDALGRRWAYPRSMLPWELEPARVALDLGAWDR